MVQLFKHTELLKCGLEKVPSYKNIVVVVNTRATEKYVEDFYALIRLESYCSKRAMRILGVLLDKIKFSKWKF